MLSLDENLKKRLLTIIVGAPIVVSVIYVGGVTLQIALGVAMFIAFYEWFSMSKKAKMSILVSFFGLVYVLAGFYSIYKVNEIGYIWTLGLLALVWSSDILAYIFGKMIGGAKMSPTISPNKTWSGYFGALLAPAIISGVVSSAPLFGVVIGVVGQSGDLLVSALKRHVNVKDTGALFPGHGGILDRIDALLLVAPVYLVGVLYIV